MQRLSCGNRTAIRPVLATLVMLMMGAGGFGCGALLLVGGAGTSAIAFATGELRSTESHSLANLDAATTLAVETLGYGALEIDREASQVRFRAKTAGGDPVDIRLAAKGPRRTLVRIRIGVFGDEARSRLVLEQIHQSL